MVVCSFEEGLKFLPVSTDLWLHYCIWKSDRGLVDETRSLFERATKACGSVYTSNLLWDKYLDFEKGQKNFEGMEKIFWQLLTFPTSKLYEYYTRFKNLIDMHYKDLPEDQKRKKKDDIIQAYEKVVSENNKCKSFEQAIKRSNFSTKPLDPDQHMNWRKYLEYEENNKNHEKIVLLYERCIVPCCYYAEFWIRYSRYIEKTQGIDEARNLYIRANKNFLSRRPELFVAQGYFEETHNNISEARKLYKHSYENVSPGLLDGILKHAQLERREKNFSQVDELYQQALSVAIEIGTSSHVAYVTTEYARFHYLVMQDLNRAIGIFEESLDKATSQKSIYFAYISTLNSLEDLDEKLKKIKAAYELGLRPESKLPLPEQLEMWVSYMDFMRNSWKNYEDVKEAEGKFRKIFHHQNVLTVEFKGKCGIKRMKRNENLDYPEPVKRLI